MDGVLNHSVTNMQAIYVAMIAASFVLKAILAFIEGRFNTANTIRIARNWGFFITFIAGMLSSRLYSGFIAGNLTTTVFAGTAGVIVAQLIWLCFGAIGIECAK